MMRNAIQLLMILPHDDPSAFVQSSSICCIISVCLFLSTLMTTILTCVRQNIVSISGSRSAGVDPTQSESKCDSQRPKTPQFNNCTGEMASGPNNEGRKAGIQSSDSSQEQHRHQVVTGCRKRSECCWKQRFEVEAIRPLNVYQCMKFGPTAARKAQPFKDCHGRQKYGSSGQPSPGKSQPINRRRGPKKYGYTEAPTPCRAMLSDSCRTPIYGYAAVGQQSTCKDMASDTCKTPAYGYAAACQPSPSGAQASDNCRTPKYGYATVGQPSTCRGMASGSCKTPGYGYVAAARQPSPCRAQPSDGCITPKYVGSETVDGLSDQKQSKVRCWSKVFGRKQKIVGCHGEGQNQNQMTQPGNVKSGAMKVFRYNIPPKREGEEQLLDILACTILAKPTDGSSRKSRTPTAVPMGVSSTSTVVGGRPPKCKNSDGSPHPPPSFQPVLCVNNLPNDRITFHGPFDQPKIHRFLFCNEGPRDGAIGWALQTRNPRRLCATPWNGILGGQQSILIGVKCRPFGSESEPNNNSKNQQDTDNNRRQEDQLSILWGVIPFNVTVFDPTWITRGTLNKRMNITIVYST